MGLHMIEFYRRSDQALEVKFSPSLFSGTCFSLSNLKAQNKLLYNKKERFVYLKHCFTIENF